jgi:hypothetical protein
MNLRHYFDRVVLINLKRRPDRLAQARRALRACRWPFKAPEIFEAVDGRVRRPPAWWPHNAASWACLKSHQRVLKKALADQVKNILILEDDVCFANGFPTAVRKFLRAVPDDWDQLMLGGQQVNLHGKPVFVQPGVYRCTDCERTHCYAVRGPYLRKLCRRLARGGKYNGATYLDWIMGRDPDLQFAHRVYAPQFFLVGQERGDSDIFGVALPRKFWNPPGPDLVVINLHAPARVAFALARHGWCFGRGGGRGSNLEDQLNQVFADTTRDPAARRVKLREWIKVMQWELAADPAMHCTVWHPAATPRLVQAASPWPVWEITATSVDAALAKFAEAQRTAPHSRLPSR